MLVISKLFIPWPMTHKIPRWHWQCWSTVLSSANELGRAQRGQQLIARASLGSVKTQWLSLWPYKQVFLTLHLLKLQISQWQSCAFSHHEASWERQWQGAAEGVQCDENRRAWARTHTYINKGSRSSNKQLLILEILLYMQTGRIRLI